MNEASDRGHDLGSRLEVVPAVGTVSAAIAAAGVIVPLRRGSEEPVVLVAVALAVAALVVFLARRHGALSRTVSGPLAAGASVGVVLTCMWLLNHGIFGAVHVSTVSWSVSLVGTSFVAAGLTTGLAIADYGGRTGGDVTKQVSHTVGMVVLSLVASVVAALWISLFQVPVVVIAGEVTELADTAIGPLANAFGFLSVAIGFLVVTDREWSFLDVRVPTLRDVGWVVAGIVAIFVVSIVIDVALTATGVEGSTHSSIERGQENPEILLLLVPASLLLIGPFEEIFYRNVVQKSLYDSFSRGGAIVAASLVFAAVHFTAYAANGAPLEQVLPPLGIVFVLSLLLGTIYERTENILVPSAVHGLYNAFVFMSQYSMIVSG